MMGCHSLGVIVIRLLCKAVSRNPNPCPATSLGFGRKTWFEIVTEPYGALGISPARVPSVRLACDSP